MGIMEKRAKAFCARIKALKSGETMSFTVDKKSSKLWSCVASITARDGKLCCIGGCGFNHTAAALAEVLQWLGDTREVQLEIWQKAEGGENSARSVLQKYGYTLETMLVHRDYTTFQIIKK